jgi:hypothetical protein
VTLFAGTHFPVTLIAVTLTAVILIAVTLPMMMIALFRIIKLTHVPPEPV